ncbi:hypothetical protein TRICHSKD4_4696 [Roseibium sp. TrichSKD4]|nr:hypothetical protein TRICHSKD4_4696 [Roseibium sp. TrichSKD4]
MFRGRKVLVGNATKLQRVLVRCKQGNIPAASLLSSPRSKIQNECAN